MVDLIKGKFSRTRDDADQIYVFKVATDFWWKV
jgi:hypothetical protein